MNRCKAVCTLCAILCLLSSWAAMAAATNLHPDRRDAYSPSINRQHDDAVFVATKHGVRHIFYQMQSRAKIIYTKHTESYKYLVSHWFDAKISPHLKSIFKRNKLSPYDHLVQKYAHRYNFDWMLITAQMYQESRFDPNAKSCAGALGLMQIMPRTAAQLGVEDLENPELAIHAGVRYLAWLAKRFEPNMPEEEKIWFILAAYNAGIGHVRDARRLAVDLGLHSDRWFDNVEKAMLLLAQPRYAKNSRYGYVRGSEPVRYVRAIRHYHQQYRVIF